MKGIALVEIGDWTHILYLAAADRELSCSLVQFLSVDMYDSSDDSTRLCNVESIQDNPLVSLVHSCGANLPLHCLGGCLCQAWGDPLKYVLGSIGSLNAILIR